MPSQKAASDYKRFMDTGICDCGKHMSVHRKGEGEVRTEENDCVLTQETIYRWHTPRFND